MTTEISIQPWRVVPTVAMNCGRIMDATMVKIREINPVMAAIVTL